MNMAAFAAAMVAINNARKEIGALDVKQLDIDVKLTNVQISLCEELIKELKGSVVSPNELSEDEKRLVKQGAYKGYGSYTVPNKIQTIKQFRERTGHGLADSKRIVENYLRTQSLGD